MTDPLPGDAPEPSRSGLGRASAILASGTLVSRILGFVKVIVLAATIGQVGSASADAFAVGNQLPNNIYALIAGGLLGAILVPQIVRAGLHDDGGQRYINKIVTLGAVSFIAIAAAVTLLAPVLVTVYASSDSGDGRGFSPEGIALATAFAYWCLPQVLFYALYSLLGEVLNARKVFGPFTWAPVVNNVVVIASLVLFQVLFGGAADNSDVAVWDASRIALLAGTATLGVAAQALVLIVFWKRSGLTYRPDFAWRGVGLARTGKAAGWVFGMILITQLAGIVQSQVATEAAGEGASVFTLQNAWLIFMLPHSVIAVSIATAYFTRMSGHATTGDFAGVRADVRSSLSTIGLFITFASIALLVVAFPFARAFESSGFENVGAMALVIMAFAIGLVPFSAVFVLQRVFYSLEDTRTPFFVETLKAGVFVAGAFACTLLPIEFIALGIALVTTLACVVQFATTFILLRRRLGPIGGGFLLRRHAQYLLASIIAGAVGAGVLALTGGYTADGFGQSSLAAAVAVIALSGIAMIAVYAAVLLLVRNPDASAAVSTVAARIRRSR